MELFGSLLCNGLLVAVAAQRLVAIRFAEQHALLVGYETVTDIRQVATTHADGVRLVHILGNSHQSRHRSERNAPEVHVQSGTNDAYAALCQFGAYLNYTHVEKLSLVNTYYINVVSQKQDGLAGLNWCGLNDIVVVRYDILLAVANIDSGLENLYAKLGKLCAFHPADQFLGLAGKHTAAYDLNATASQSWSFSVSFVEHICNN